MLAIAGSYPPCRFACCVFLKCLSTAFAIFDCIGMQHIDAVRYFRLATRAWPDVIVPTSGKLWRLTYNVIARQNGGNRRGHRSRRQPSGRVSSCVLWLRRIVTRVFWSYRAGIESLPTGYAFPELRLRLEWLPHDEDTCLFSSNKSKGTFGCHMTPVQAGGQREYMRVRCASTQSSIPEQRDQVFLE